MQITMGRTNLISFFVPLLNADVARYLWVTTFDCHLWFLSL